jgi:hypothetical protein
MWQVFATGIFYICRLLSLCLHKKFGHCTNYDPSASHTPQYTLQSDPVRRDTNFRQFDQLSNTLSEAWTMKKDGHTIAGQHLKSFGIAACSEYSHRKRFRRCDRD